MKRVSSLVLISLGLVAVTLGVMVVGRLLVDLTPDQSAQERAYRRSLSEALAFQYSKLAERGDHATIKFALQTLVERNHDVLSATLRRVDGSVLVRTGEHARAAEPPPGALSPEALAGAGQPVGPHHA